MATHVFQIIHSNQHSQYPKSDKKQPETWKQDGGGQKIQKSKERKIQLIS